MSQVGGKPPIPPNLGIRSYGSPRRKNLRVTTTVLKYFFLFSDYLSKLRKVEEVGSYGFFEAIEVRGAIFHLISTQTCQKPYSSVTAPSCHVGPQSWTFAVISPLKLKILVFFNEVKMERSLSREALMRFYYCGLSDRFEYISAILLARTQTCPR